MDRRHPSWMGPGALAAAALAALSGCSDAPAPPSVAHESSLSQPRRFQLPADVHPVALEISPSEQPTIENPYLQAPLPTPFASSMIGLPPLPEAAEPTLEPAAPTIETPAPRYMPLIEAQPQTTAERPTPIQIPTPNLDQPEPSFSLQGPQNGDAGSAPSLAPSQVESSRWSRRGEPTPAVRPSPEMTPELAPELADDASRVELLPLAPGRPNEADQPHEMRTLPELPPAPELSSQPPRFMPRIEAEPQPAAQPEPEPQPGQLPAALVEAEPAPLPQLPIPSQAFDQAPQMQRHDLLDQHAMTAIRGRAQSLVEHGLSLAQRGAFFSARAEFIQALRLLTQTLDTERHTHQYSEALGDGLLALEEASDFVPEGSRLEANINLRRLIQSHRTPILQNVDADQLTPLVAAQQYFSHAQDRLTFACGGIPEASSALYGLAKLQPYLKNGSGGDKALIGPRSIALHQSAFLADPKNILAANELGVLLARYGQLTDAKQVFINGLRQKSLADTWNNLAKVHEMLGEPSLAKLAREEAKYAADHGSVAPKSDFVRWVSPDAFAAQRQIDATAVAPPRSNVGRRPQSSQQR
ncbi:MAG: hypothetical protein ACIALR_11390 [Blastopirellula sp. JB062]